MADLYKTLMTVLHEHFQELGEKEEHTVAKVLKKVSSYMCDISICCC